ncbi:MAG: putative hydroxymethylpyrimidine transporter CytX [Bacillota bacterium]|nr:putative hydroxymethylpyrimidine transporter CytX [Bacillota bacterium]
MNKTAKKGSSLPANALIWFGAAVSIAEIHTGSLFAPLGFGRGLLAILLGHLIGCLLLFLSGLIGGRLRRSAMESVKSSFGQKGGLLFSVLNILQLLGWTGIMIYDGALAANAIYALGHWLWCLLIGALILLWILIGIRNLGKLNSLAMLALFSLSLLLCFRIFGSGSMTAPSGEALSFGAAVELSAAMPLSWLPLISDYTREAEKPLQATAVSALVYGLVSCWMYLIGMGAALLTGESEIAQILLRAGLGIGGLLIVVLSTVTTTFLDAYSAGVSGEALSARIPGKWLALAAAALGTAGAIFLPLHDITDFLYLIGSVFAPMIAIQIADFFILKQDHSHKAFSPGNLLLWALGFLLYRLLMQIDLPLGSTLPDMLICILLCLLFSRLRQRRQAAGRK